MEQSAPRSPFRIERLLRPRSLAVIGAGTEAGRQVIGNLQAAAFGGPILPVAAGCVAGMLAYPTIADLPMVPDLAVIAAAPDAVAPALMALGQRRCPAAIVLGPAPGLEEAVRASGVRVLGDRSFGVAVPGIGLNATRSHLPIRRGKVALVSQSASLCRAVIDWAEPNGVGFSHIVGIGGNADLGFSTILDWLSRDADTGAILLDLHHVKNRIGFLSAARAAARLRPVVAIRAGSRLDDPSGLAELTLEAALRRAGVLSVDSLEALLAAAETLTRARPPRREELAIVTNAAGLGRMAADAALRDGLRLATLSEPTRAGLSLLLPEPAPSRALVSIGPGSPIRLAEVAAALSSAPEIGGIMVMLAPTGAGDAAAISALAACAATVALPLLVCVMGETTAASFRRQLAEAGLPVFDGPAQAVRGFLHLVQSRRSRAAARELPPRTVLELAPDREAVARAVAAARAENQLCLGRQAVADILTAYGIRLFAGQSRVGTPRRLAIRVVEDAMFGPAISLGGAVDLPPLNLPLAHALVARSDAAETPALAEMLVRVSQLVVDFPEIAALDLDPVFADADGVQVAEGRLRLHDAADAGHHLAIAPYPAELTGSFLARGETLTVRAIRPEDAEAHAAFFHRLAPEDVRYRFFSAMREISPEQMARMTQVDYHREMAFIAARANGETVGVSRLVSEGTGCGEFAVVVQPDMKGCGLASHLMQRLIAWAPSQGMAEIVGLILAENAPMLAFARHLGFRLRHLPEEPDLIQATLVL